MPDTTRFLAFSCLHAPLTHKGFFSWLIAQIEEFRPAVIVNLGDWYEGKPAKRWPVWSDERWSLSDEHRAVAEQADAIHAAAPDARKVWLYGNHDDNLFGMQPERIKEDLWDAVQWSENRIASKALALWKVIRNYGDRQGIFCLGPITFQHGVDAAVNGEKRAAYFNGVPNGLYVCGHTHSPVKVTRAAECRTYLPYWYANVGCGADWDRMHYVTRAKIRTWGRACIVGECKGVQHRHRVYASKNWDAELRVHSLVSGGTL